MVDMAKNIVLSTVNDMGEAEETTPHKKEENYRNRCHS